MAFYHLSKRFASTELVTYRTSDENLLSLDQVMSDIEDYKDVIFVIHWGPDVSSLAHRLRSHNCKVVYFAHSTGWGIKLDEAIPIVCVSKNTQSIWGRQSPSNLILNVQNVLDEQFYADDTPKDIDVLIQKRKSSDYLLYALAPELSKHCNVVILDDWVDSLSDYFRRSKVYLYDSVGHWIEKGATEGFGLPPMEAMACGCVVYSSVNDALSDYLDPGFNCGQIGVFSLSYDVDQILKSVKTEQPKLADLSIFDIYRKENVAQRLKHVFEKVDYFFKFTEGSESNIPKYLPPQKPNIFKKVISKALPESIKHKFIKFKQSN